MKYFIEELDTETLSSIELQWYAASAEQLVFMQRVYDLSRAFYAYKGNFIDIIPEHQLKMIENGKKAKANVAAACCDLLAAVRCDIQKAGEDVIVGVVSGYRSAAHQFTLWQNYFPGYYRDTMQHRSILPGGPHGDEAAHYTARFVAVRIATPGYSNHQHGIAIDFLNRENDILLRNNSYSESISNWKQSWFWNWLVKKANVHGFHQNTDIDEPWHWEYRERPGISPVKMFHFMNDTQYHSILMQLSHNEFLI